MDEAFKEFVVEYGHEGTRWVTTIKARDAADAQRRICNLQFATVKGELMAVIKVPGMFERLVRWLVGK